MITTHELGFLAKKKRQELGLTLEDASALCNVGKRFLIDLEKGKESVHMGLAFRVLSRLGITLSVSDTVLASRPATFLPLIWHSPPYDEGHWLKVNVALVRASCIVLNMPWVAVETETDSHVEITFKSPCISVENSHTDSMRELFIYLEENSDNVLLDLRNTLRGVIFSLIVDYRLTASSMWHCQTGPDRGCHFIFPRKGWWNELKDEKGQGRARLNIKGETNPDWMRGDHFSQLAVDANVHPKIVFEMIRQMAEEVPKQIRLALEMTYQSRTFRNAALAFMNLVEARSLRLRDLVTAAEHQGNSGTRVKKYIDVSRKKTGESKIGFESPYE